MPGFKILEPSVQLRLRKEEWFERNLGEGEFEVEIPRGAVPLLGLGHRQVPAGAVRGLLQPHRGARKPTGRAAEGKAGKRAGGGGTGSGVQVEQESGKAK